MIDRGYGTLQEDNDRLRRELAEADRKAKPKKDPEVATLRRKLSELERTVERLTREVGDLKRLTGKLRSELIRGRGRPT